MSSKVETAFLAALAKITGTGNFHSEGRLASLPPEIRVRGAGELSFPLPEAEVRRLIAIAEAAPYGKGLETLRDDSVRRCWQIDARHLDLSAPIWNAMVTAALGAVKKDLGIKAEISALPYKLLIYEKGGHFLPHRDTEKLESMFGTFIIALPSAHEGGALHIRHGGREVVVDFSKRVHEGGFPFVALFADCEHEVKPVRSGHRCCLVYNLKLENGKASSLNRPVDVQAKALVPPLRRLVEERPRGLTAVLLEHSYTEANFSLRNLKGNDSSRARVFLAAADELGLVAHLGLVTYHQMGELEGGDFSCHSHRYRRFFDDDEEEVDEMEGEMGEIYDESLSVNHWRDAKDRPAKLGVYSLKMEDLITREAIDAREPDEKESEGFTGNAGCTMEYWYHRAAVVWWRREDHERILCAQSPAGACRELFALAGKKGKIARESFERLARAIVDAFPAALPHFSAYSRSKITAGADDEDEYDGFFDDEEVLDPGEEAFTVALAAFARAGSADCVAKLIDRVPPAAFGMCRPALWRRLFQAFGSAPFRPVIDSLLDEGTEIHRHLLFVLLEVAHALPSEEGLARRLISRLVRIAPQAPKRGWEPRRDPAPSGDPNEARTLLMVSPMITDPTERHLALSFLKSDQSLAYVREILGPLLLEIVVIAVARRQRSLYPDLLNFATETLKSEISRELKPYSDWTRPCPPPPVPRTPTGWSPRRRPQPDPLGELANFMADPAERSHDFKRAEFDRSTVEEFIRANLLDLDQTTIKVGTPYTLRVTKNDSSYLHALAVRKKDESLLAKLGATR